MLLVGTGTPAPRRSRPTMALFAAMVLAGAGLLSACGTTGGFASSADEGSAVVASAPDVAMPAEAVSADGMGAQSDKVATSVDRQVIMTASMSVRVDDVKGQGSRISALAVAAGGLVQQQDLTMSDGLPYAYVTVRVPADRLDQLITNVSALGSVENLTTQAADVTQQTVDLDARIGALTTSVQRLRALLAAAENVADLVAVETELATRQAELDSLVSQRDYLADQVAMSTLSVSLSPVVAISTVSAPGFWPGLQNGLNAFAALVSGSITALGFLLPFVAAAAVIALLTLGIIHWRSRRRGARTEMLSPEVRESTKSE